MKTLQRILVVLLLAAAAFTTVLLIKDKPLLSRADEASELFHHYKDNPHLQVGFIKDFALNDTVTIDITTLAAVDSIGCNLLIKDFNMSPPPDFMEPIPPYQKRAHMRLFPKGHPDQPTDTLNITNNDLVETNWTSHSLCVFHLQTMQQFIDATDLKILFNIPQ